jgi:hypothetical protein
MPCERLAFFQMADVAIRRHSANVAALRITCGMKFLNVPNLILAALTVVRSGTWREHIGWFVVME